MANVTNTLVKAQLPQKTTLSVALTSDSVQRMLQASLGDQKAITKFTTDIMAAYGATPTLSTCEPQSVIVAGLQCAALNLSASPALGEAYIIPYGDKATFQIGRAGLVRLALRSGMYSKINSMTVKDGEYKGLDKYTGEPTFEFITDDTKRENTPVIGYLAVFELKPEMGSYRKAIYFGREKTMNWAKRYSKAFDIDLYHKYEVYLKTGEGLSERELQKCSSPWYSSFDEMGEKTVLKQLIRKWGILSVDMQTAFENDDNAEFGKPINDVFTAPEVTLDTVADEPKQTEEQKTEETAPKEKKTSINPTQTIAPAKAVQPTHGQPKDDDDFFKR